MTHSGTAGLGERATLPEGAGERGAAGAAPAVASFVGQFVELQPRHCMAQKGTAGLGERATVAEGAGERGAAGAAQAVASFAAVGQLGELQPWHTSNSKHLLSTNTLQVPSSQVLALKSTKSE